MEQHCWLAVVVRNQSYLFFRLSKGNTAIVVSKVDSYCSPLALKIVKVQLCSLSLFEAIINLHPNAYTQVNTNGDQEYISGRKLVLRVRWLVWGVLTSHYLGRRLVLHKRKRFLVFRPTEFFIPWASTIHSWSLLSLWRKPPPTSFTLYFHHVCMKAHTCFSMSGFCWGFWILINVTTEQAS